MRHLWKCVVAAVGVAFVLACASSASAPARGPGAIPPVTGAPRARAGIRVVDIAEGTGTAYAARKCIYTHYTGWLEDGTRFDSSRDAQPSEPVVFLQGARRVMDGWEVGFEGMRVGGKRRLLIPYQLGYGAKGNPPVIPARANLVFDVELMAVTDMIPRARASGSSGAAATCPAWRSMM